MIVPVNVQLKGESEPKKHLALVFPDAVVPKDFADYRNALTNTVKTILCNDGECLGLSDECFYLLQLSEFINTALDKELKEKEPCL